MTDDVCDYDHLENGRMCRQTFLIELDKLPNQVAAANRRHAGHSSVVGVRERAVRSTAIAEAVAELGLWATLCISKEGLDL